MLRVGYRKLLPARVAQLSRGHAAHQKARLRAADQIRDLAGPDGPNPAISWRYAQETNRQATHPPAASLTLRERLRGRSIASDRARRVSAGTRVLQARI